MLTPKLINYFKDQNWWFEEEEPQLLSRIRN